MLARAGAGLVVAALTSLTVACGHDDPGHDTVDAGARDARGDTPDGDPAITPPAGVAVATEAAAFLVTLVATDPTPLDTGNTSFQLRVTMPDGDPVDDAEVSVRGWMPAHGHGTNPAERAASADGEGRWTAAPINLFMPGTWELTVAVDDGARRDSVTYTVRLRP